MSGSPAGPDAGLRQWLRDPAKNHPRRGSVPPITTARGEGWIVNHKRLQRLWREEGLRVPVRRRRKRLGSSTAPDTAKADAPNKVWAVDFQFDSTSDRRPIKIASITGDALIDELDRLAQQHGYPARTGTIHGSRHVSSAAARMGLPCRPFGLPD